MESTSQSSTQKVSVETMGDREVLRSHGLMMGENVGYGSYSKVKFAIETKTMAKVAVKVIDRNKAPKDFLKNFLPRELDILTDLEHENIITTYGHFSFNEKVYILQEFAENGDVLSYIRMVGSALPERLAKQWIRETTAGLEYLHKQGITHRDLKCENLLLDYDMTVKITDFGFARFVEPDDLSKTYCGSAAYASPEILKSQPYHPMPSDIWALGVVTYILTCGEMPFGDDTTNVSKIMRRQQDGIVFPLLRRLSPECKELLKAMLRIQPKERITAEEVLANRWLNVPASTTKCNTT
ncbi:testis-specific serine/threonine-protein kinase 2-like [Glandiceps talaboti]